MALAYFNGSFIQSDEPVVPIDERGHQFGDGVYEVIRIYKGRPFMLDEHLDRLFKSAAAIRLEIGHDGESLKRIIGELTQKSGLSDLDLYVQATRGIAPRNHLFPVCPASVSMTAKPFREISAEARASGISVMLHPDERWLNCWIKSLNLLPNILAKQAASERGCLEAVLVRDGVVTEGTSSNVYMVKDGAIRTAPLSKQILAGITRMAVQRIAHELRIPFVEQSFTPEELRQADEAFITSTTTEVMPVVRFEDGSLIRDGSPGPVALALYERFRTMTGQD